MLRRSSSGFTRSHDQHPTYRAIVELGKAVKTIFLCRFLHDEALRQEIHDGLQVIENWNSANDFIFYGRGGDMATNRLEDQEMAMLALHLLQISLVYINTLMVQNPPRTAACGTLIVAWLVAHCWRFHPTPLRMVT